MPRIFISYRRADSQAITDRIQEHLSKVFGNENVFQDVLGIKYGEDFRKVLSEEVNTSDILLVIIGPTWLSMTDDQGNRRLDNPNDFVRIEVEVGLQNAKVRVIPILVNGSRHVRVDDLPESLQELAYRHAIEVRNNPHFDSDIEILSNQLRKLYGVWLLSPIHLRNALLLIWKTVKHWDRKITLGVLIVSLILLSIILIGFYLPSSGIGYIKSQNITANNQWKPIYKSFDGFEMVLVPTGCFSMGNDPDSRYFDRNGNWQINTGDGGIQCFEEAFWIDQYEVTRIQFGSSQNNEDANLPAQDVSWFDAKAFCKSRGARLPTESEWEYAARGPTNLAYPWGDTWIPTNVVWASQESDNVGSRVGGASWVGAFDLSGNVWEWTTSRYDWYPYIKTDGREADSSDPSILRVLRGGSRIYNDPNLLRAANRLPGFGDAHYPDWGFRCARDYEE